GVVASTYRRGNSTTSISLRLTDAGQFEALKAALTTDPRIKVDIDTTRNYYNKQSENLTQAIRILGITVGTIMAVGAIFGALGAGLAWAVFDDYTASTLGNNFSQIVFAFNVTPKLLWNGLKWALAIGFIGGLFPAVR